MRYDKSLKLVNYANRYQYGLTTAGHLQLYTELDHSFIVGDRVYIVGGYFDNCNKNLYTNANPFDDQFCTGYKVIAIFSNNSFVIEYPPLYNGDAPFNTNAVVYPYGSGANNRYGDPFDNTNQAYNCYTTTVEKGVYVSTTAFTRGIMKKGTINNGIFGNDYHTVKLNNKGTVSGTVTNSDLVINHIVGKNIEISKGQINSKTDVSNLPTSKIKLVEDGSYILNSNPFYLISEAVGNNNDGFGYNCFERITNTATDIIVNNGIFSNPNNSYIALNNISINKAKLGSNTFTKSLANQIDTVTIGTGYVGNINTLNDKFIANGATVNTFIPLTLEIGNATPVAYSATLKQIDIQVEYDVLANHYTNIGSTVYISGIVGTTNYDLTHVTGTIAAMSYTFGTLNSAVISIVFDIAGVTTGGDWTAWKAANPVANYDFSNMQIHLTQNIFEAGIFSGATISSYFDSSINFTTPDLVIDNSTIIEAYVKGVTLKGSNVFNGSSKGKSAYITLCAQIDQDITGPTTYTYSRIYGNITPLYGGFDNALIEKGIIQNSSMFDTICIPRTLGTDVIFLYNSRLSGMMYLHDEVYWDLLNTRDVTRSFISGAVTYVQGAYLGNGRNTPWTTASNNVGDPELKMNPNRIQGILHDSSNGVIYQSQSIAKSSNSSILGLPTNLTKKIHVPSSENIQDPLSTTEIIVIHDKGSLSLTASNWNSTNNRDDILYAEYLAGGTLDTKIDNRNNAITLPANDADFPFVDQGLAYRDLNTIDSNYIYTVPYFKTPHIREASEINLTIYETAPLIAPYDNQFPDPAIPASLTTQLKIQGGPGTYLCNDGATVNINNGTYTQLFLKVVGTVDNGMAAPAAIVPQCFIEIERVFVKTYTSGFGAITRVFLYEPNSTLNDFDRMDQVVAAGLFTNEELLLYQHQHGGAPVNFTIGGADNIEIIVDYWVTWFYYDTGYNATADSTTNGYKGSARTKRTETYRFN